MWGSTAEASLACKSFQAMDAVGSKEGRPTVCRMCLRPDAEVVELTDWPAKVTPVLIPFEARNCWTWLANCSPCCWLRAPGALVACTVVL